MSTGPKSQFKISRKACLIALAVYGFCWALAIAFYLENTRSKKSSVSALTWAQAVKRFGSGDGNGSPTARAPLPSSALTYDSFVHKRDLEGERLANRLFSARLLKEQFGLTPGSGDPVRLLSQSGKLREAEALQRKMLDAVTDYWQKLPASELSRADKIIAAADEGELVFRLSCLLSARGKYKEAKELMDRACLFGRHKRGKQPFVLAEELSAAGWIEANLGNERAADEALSEALKIRKENFGENDLLVAWSLDQLSWLKAKGGDKEATANLLARARLIRSRAPAAPDSANLVSDYASFLSSINRKEDARELLARLSGK